MEKSVGMGSGLLCRRYLSAAAATCLASLSALLIAGCGGTTSASDAPTATPAASPTAAAARASASPAKLSSTPYFYPTPTPIPTYAVPTGTAIPAGKLAMTVNGLPVYLSEWELYREEQMRAIWASQHVDPLSAAGLPTLQNEMTYVKKYLIYRELLRPYMQRYHTQVTDAQLRQAEKQFGSAARLKQAIAARDMTMDQYKDQLWLQNTVNYIVNHHTYEDTLAHLQELYVASQADAQQIADTVSKGGDFATQARAHSLDQASSSRGGDIGFVAVSQLRKPLDTLALSLPLKTVSQPIHIGTYFYLIEVLGRQFHVPLAGTNLAAAKNAFWQQWYQSHLAAAKVRMFVTVG
jgi:hypothetical protein